MPGVIRRGTRILDPHPLLGFGGRGSTMVESAVLQASSAVLGGVNEQQTVTITGTPTSGNFTLTLDGATTGNIAFNAASGAVQAALEALPNIGVGNAAVSGGPGPGTPFVVTFQNALGRKNVNQMSAAHTFGGGTTPAIAVTTTTPGSALDAGIYVVHRGKILKKNAGTNKVIPWVAGTDAAALIFGVLARTVEFFDQSDVSDGDVPVYTGPGCTFNDVVLALQNPNYAGGAANFLTWAQQNGNRVGSQAI